VACAIRYRHSPEKAAFGAQVPLRAAQIPPEVSDGL